MIEIFDRATRRWVAIAENAHAVSEEKRINAVWYLYFSLPYQDPKRASPERRARRAPKEIRGRTERRALLGRKETRGRTVRPAQRPVKSPSPF